MADDLDQEDRTEDASGRRLDKAFEEGQVPLGRDAVAAGAIFGGLLALSSVAGPLRDGMLLLVRQGLASVARNAAPPDHGPYTRVLLLAMVVCAGAATGATLVTVAQTRGGFWPDLVMPDPTRLFQGRLGRIFSKEGLADLGVAVVKVVVIGSALSVDWYVRFVALIGMIDTPPATLLDASASWFAPMATRAFVAVLLLAGMDIAVTRYRFAQRLKMTREEIKREARDDDGDPLIRGRRRKKHRELIRNRARHEVPRADALVVNPTHIAIAIRYRKEDGGAPRVTAKGKGVLAEAMRELAREHGIPIVENIPLARLLYKRVKVGREVPAETYKAVAAILAFVYRITGRRIGQRGAA